MTLVWQDRALRLQQLAGVIAEEVEMLAAFSHESVARLGGEHFRYLEAHRGDPALRAGRLAAYAPLAAAEACPACWVKEGERMPLALREVIGGADLMACPRCGLRELLPNALQRTAARE